MYKLYMVAIKQTYATFGTPPTIRYLEMKLCK